MEIIAKTASEAWKESLKHLITDGLREGNTTRETLEVVNMHIKVLSPEDITGPMDELRQSKKWIYPEVTEIEDVMFRKEGIGSYHYTYGERLFNFDGARNQLDGYIIPLLKADPESRRAIAVLYNPTADSEADNKTTPSLISMFFKMSRGKLTVTATLRSNNMLIGWPASIYQAFLLQKYVANQLGVEQGEISTISHAAHIKREHEEDAREIILA